MLDEKDLKEGAMPVDSTNDKTVENQREQAKPTKRRKQNSALIAASMGRSAIGAVKGHASGDVGGSSDGTANTGVIISYESED